MKMMKRVLAGILAAGMLLSLAGCGREKESKSDYSAYCKLGEYKGLSAASVERQTVTDQEIEEHIEAFRKKFSDMVEITDRPVQEGDVVNIDYKGYMDGEAFDGGEGNYDLEIGSDSFIPGFEDGLIGAQLGETLDVTATFPEPYQNNPSFSGKEAVFTVTVNSISAYDLEEFTDAFVDENSDFDSVEAYRSYVRESLQAQYDSTYESDLRTALVSQVSANSTFESLPEDKLEEYTDYWQDYMAAMASYYGYSDDLDGFLAMQGMDQEGYDAWVQGMAEENCRQFLIYTLIAEAEGITVTQEEIQSEIDEDAAGYSLEADAYLETYRLTREDYEYQVLCTKVLDFLVENAVTE